MTDITHVSRREALGLLGALGAFALGVRLRTAAAASGAAAGGEVTLFVSIRADGRTLLTSHRSEMGQHVWTAMAQIIADELEADWARVEVVQAPGDAKYGDQNTDGSRSVRRNLDRLRRVGAAMRAMLRQAAATRWGVEVGEVVAKNHEVVHAASKRRLGYGELAEDAAKLPVPAEPTLKARAAWRYIGKPVASVTVPTLVRGGGTFGADVRLPGMLYAVIARPPRLYAPLRGVDDAAAKAVPGVVRTVRLPTLEAPPRFAALGGVAVVARDTWAALRGRDALRLDWGPGPNADYDSAAFLATMQKTAAEPGTVRRSRGDAEGALAMAAKQVEAEYHVPHLAHAPMEPPVAVARWTGDRVECWACVQAPQSARKAVAEACGVPLEKVTINVTWLGGGFGRKSKPDFVVEAARVARAAGAPVKLQWTREDDLRHGYYHTVSVQRLTGGLAADGRCVAWRHRTVFPPIGSTFAEGNTTPSWGELRMGCTDVPFAVPNLRVESGEAKAHVRIGWLRSVANIYHAFAVQSFAAELAAAAKRDPKDYLLELIGPPRHVDPRGEGAEYDNYGDSLEDYPIDTGRLAAVVRQAATMARWGRKLPPGHGLGIAAHRSFLSYVATVVEVAWDSATKRLSIPGVWSVMDAGTVVNPGSARSQLEGGTLFGLSNALYGAITAKRGAVQQRNFPDFRLMRMDEAPRVVQVQVVESDAPPGGVGEPPTPPAAPALCNAIFAATGKRVRHLPVFRDGSPNRLEV